MSRCTGQLLKTPFAGATKQKYTIKVYDNIDDPELIHAWTRIVEDFEYFPQSSYGWCAAWWRRLSGKRKLHVAAAFEETGSIVGIAPLCIDSRIGMRSLRSFPIHFGDFYTFLIVRDGRYESIFDVFLKHILSFSRWDMVRLEQVNSDDKLWKLLELHGFLSKELTNVVVVGFEGKSFDEYLQSLSANRRKDLRKKVRRLERDKKVELVKVQDYQGYLSYAEKMKEMYDERWSDDVMILTERYYECRSEAVKACFDDGRMLLYILQADDIAIAYQLSFITDRTFYTWKESHSPAYAYYSPGAVIKFYFMRDLIENGFSKVNFMAGDYEFKRTMAKEGWTTTNYSVMLSKRSLRGWFMLRYYLQWRDFAKLYYNKILNYRFARRLLSRRI